MKQLKLLVVAILLSVMSYAQTLETQTVNPRDYSSNNQDLNFLLQEVYNIYSNVNEVEVLRLTPPQQNVPSEVQSRLAQEVKTLDYMQWSDENVINELFESSPDVLKVEFTYLGKLYSLDLIKSNFVTDDLFVLNENDEEILDSDFGLQYKGIVHGDENSMASLSVYNDEIVLNLANEELSIEITKLNKAEGNLHAIFSTSDVLNPPSMECHASDLEQYGEMLGEMQAENSTQYKSYPFLANCVTYFWEVDYRLYQKLGGYWASRKYIYSLFNIFNNRLQVQNIPASLRGYKIHTSPDPYYNSSMGITLDRFSTYRKNFKADLATLLSTHPSGGIAFLNTIGFTNEYYRHAVCGGMGAQRLSLKSYSWELNVTLHEVGHNLGSPHTHDCVWNGKNTAIDGCGPTATGSTTSCPIAPIPPKDRASLMSYCHLLSYAGVNPAMLFGYQPGRLIRRRVNESVVVNKRKCYNYSYGCTNNFEPNNNRTDASYIIFNKTYTSMIRTYSDVDYFKVYNPTAASMKIYMVDPSGADFDIYFYDANGKFLKKHTGTANASSLYTGLRQKGWYYIKIVPKYRNKSNKCFSLKVSRYNIKPSTNITDDKQDVLTDVTTIFNLVPNPANDHFSINSLTFDGDIAVTIYDVSGRLAMSTTQTRTDNSIDVSSLNTGLYIVEVKNEIGTYKLKLNKQ